MSITFTSNQPNSPDYIKYVWGDIVKTDRYKDSTLLDFSLAPIDDAFVKPVRGTYITINSAKYPYWFTGYVINDPELSYLGSKNGEPVWGYKYQATSDEYILSLKPLGIMPTFMNMTWGEILKALVEKLTPGMFDVSGVQDGPLVAQYVVNPEKKFFDVAREACESASFTFRGNNKKLYYAPQDSSTIVIDGNSAHFTPARLSIRPVSASSNVINDATVLSNIEPQAYITEYMVGTGLDAKFPLASGVFGADSSVLLDEAFTGSSIDSAKWYVNDQPSMYMMLGNGYLLVNGGVAGFGVNLQSKSLIPLEGKIRLTHGDWRLTSGSGVICGLWSQPPNGSLAGCVYALRMNLGQLQPVVNGTVDSTQSLTIDTSKRYVIRTIVEFRKSHRTTQEYSYIDENGVVQVFGGNTVADYAAWDTLISEVDPTDGSVVSQVRFVNYSTLSSGTAFARYVPVASESLDAAFTGITVSVPVNATLELAAKCAVKNDAFDSWIGNTPEHWVNAVNCSKESTIVDSGVSLKMTAVGGVALIEQPVADLVTDGKRYNVFSRVRKSAGMAAGSLSFRLTGTGVEHTYTVSVSSISSTEFVYVVGALGVALPTVPSDLVFGISLSGGSEGESVYIDAVTVISDFEAKVVGPNEVDGLDGYAPVATIVSGSDNSPLNSYLGSHQYKSGQSELVFFKDSMTLESDVPPENQIIRLTYRSAGPAIGRAVNRYSMLNESANWGDDGVRSAIYNDIVPRPRTSEECELAAAAIVAENSRPHYEGSYEQWSDYFNAEPRAGAILRFDNLSSMAPVSYEEVNEVVTTLSSAKPVERFFHRVSFGKPDVSRTLLEKLIKPSNEFQSSAESVENTPVDINAVATGGVYASDVTNPSLIAWTPTKFRLDLGEDLTPDDLFFEIRYTDEGWGVDDGLNLVARTTSRIVDVPRNLRGRTYFIRKARKGNLILWSEDQTQSNYSGPARTKAVKLGPDGRMLLVTSLSLAPGQSLSGSLSGLSSGSYCGSISIKGPAGASFSLSLGGTPTAFTTTGYWQRVSCTVSGLPTALTLTNTGAVSANIEVTKFSVEVGTVEKCYAKTAATQYGPTSRYPSLVKVSFPAVEVPDTAVTESVIKSPLDYGAVGDGVTDDTVAVQTALDNLEVVEIPAGYTFLVSNIRVSGKAKRRVTGQGTIKLKNNAAEWNSPLAFYMCGEVIVEGITVDGNGSNQTYDTVQGAVFIRDCGPTTVRDVAVPSSKSVGIQIDYYGSEPTGAVLVTGCRVSNTTYGIYFNWDRAGECPSFTVSDCISIDCALNGLYLHKTNWANVSGCKFVGAHSSVLLWDATASFTGCDIAQGSAYTIHQAGTTDYTAYSCRGVADRFPIPNAPPAPAFSVDVTDPRNYTVNISIAALPANATRVAYGIQWYSDSGGTVPDGDPMWVDSFEAGKLSVEHTWSKTTQSYCRVVLIAYNGSGQASTTVYSPNVASIPPAEGWVVEPDQPDDTGWSVSLGPSQAKAFTKEQYQRVDVTIDRALTTHATYWEIWTKRDGGIPELSATANSLHPSQTAVEIWVPREDASYNYNVVLRAASDSWSGSPPLASAPWKSVAVPAISAAPQPQSWSVTLEYSDDPGGPGVIDGFVRGRYAFSVTIPASSDTAAIVIENKAATDPDTAYKPLSGNPPTQPSVLQTGGTFTWNQGPWSPESWAKPETPMQWDVRAGIEDHRGFVTYHPTVYRITISAGGGFQVTALEGKLGRGLSLNNGKVNNTAGGALVILNSEFEEVNSDGTPKDWFIDGTGCSLDSSVKETGAYSLKVVRQSMDTFAYQYVRAYPGSSYLMRWRIRVDNNAVIGGVSFHDANYNEIGYPTPTTITPTGGAFVTAECNANDLPAGTRYLLIAPVRIYSTQPSNTTAWIDSVQLFEVVSNRMIYPGVLSDPASQGWSTGAKPMLIGSVLPTLGDSNKNVYPEGTHFYYTGTLEGGRTDRLRRRVGNSWLGISGDDVAYGTISAQVGYLGSISAGQVNAGEFNGCSLVLSKSYVETKVDVFNDTAYGQYAGVSVKSETYIQDGSEYVVVPGQRTIITTGGIAALRPSGVFGDVVIWEISSAKGYGSMAFRAWNGATTIAIDSYTGTISILGNKVLSSRYPSTPTTLDGVIAVLRHHGLCA